MNNKGFTLIEFLITIVIISISLYVVMFEVMDTFSITKDTSYKLIKDNIIKTSSDYIRECNNGIIDCSLTWDGNMTFFYAKESPKIGNIRHGLVN